MTTGTMHQGGITAGVARPGPACSTSASSVGTTLPTGTFPWHAVVGKRVPTILATDRYSRRPSERSP